MAAQSQQGRVEAIWIKRTKRGPMDAVGCAELVAGKGLLGNANWGGRRQVSLLDADLWERVVADLGGALDPVARRANILLRGIDLANSRKRVLHVGDCRVRIWCETKPCERMDEALPGLKAALYPHWGGGASGQVIAGGILPVGAVAYWEDSDCSKPRDP
ncbi:MAG: sulfurase [Cyanobacteria bacterium J06641_5]